MESVREWFDEIVDPDHTAPGRRLIAGPLQVEAGVVSLRPARRRDGRAWSALRIGERDHLEPWEPSPDGDWRTRNSVASWPGVLAYQRRASRVGAIIAAVIEVDGRFAGQITLGGITRGSLCSGWIGYWVARDLNGGGVGSAALAMGVDHGMGMAGLHRLEATVRPENVGSRVVLERSGFRQEGVLERYLHVDGRWRDHLLMAKTAEEQGEGSVAALVASGVARRV